MNNTEKTGSQYATFWQRLLAHNIDVLVILGLFYLYSLVPSTKYDSIAFICIYLLYYASFESSPWRATPGKKWTKLSVVPQRPTSNLFFAIILRNGLKILSLVVFFGGFIMISLNTKRQGLHDFIAGTVVLFEEEIA